MLKVNCGLSRKLTRDFNSHGFSVNIEGEVAVDLNDAEALVEKIQAYYDVAEEVLLRQIERHESDVAIASRDEPAPRPEPVRQVAAPVAKPTPAPTPASRLPATRRASASPTEPATNKQVQFLLTIGKRDGLSKAQLESRIAEILGQPTDVYHLSKHDAGVVLDSLTADAKSASSRR